MSDINGVEIPLMQSNQLGNQLNVTCSSNGKSSTYFMQDLTSSKIQQLCTQLCSWVFTKVMIIGRRCSSVHSSVSGSHEQTSVLFHLYLLHYSGDTIRKDTFCFCRFVHFLVYIILIDFAFFWYLCVRSKRHLLMINVSP